ncbi:MAG: hypothetical protein AAF610_11775, partial [Pseudomonadota bacterium]
RAARRLSFVPAEPGDGEIELAYDLYLRDGASPVILRRALFCGQLQATAAIPGDDLAAMLETLASLDPDTQFRREGTTVADSFDLSLDGGPRLTSCAARVAGLLVELDARTVVGESMNVRIYSPPNGADCRLPDDVFALVDRRWQPLFERDDGWSTVFKAPTAEPQRTQVAMDVFARTMSHLARVLGSPPEQYHASFSRRRWRVFLRRYIPVSVCLAVVAALPLIDRYLLDDTTELHPAFLSLTPLLMIGYMLLMWRDVPLFELPPRPRALPGDAWTVPPQVIQESQSAIPEGERTR